MRLNKVGAIFLIGIVLLGACSQKSQQLPYNPVMAVEAKKIVDACVHNPSSRASIAVDRKVISSCSNESANSPRTAGGIPARYKLRKLESAIEVTLPLLHFYPLKTGDPQFDELKQKMNSILPCVQNFYRNHGIGLAFENISYGQSKSQVETAISISLSGDYGRSNSKGYHLYDQPIQDCRMVAHEFGHLLGLPDRYSEPSACPYRDVLDRDNVMGENLAGFLHPTDVQMIIEPMCDPVSPVPPKDGIYSEDIAATGLVFFSANHRDHDRSFLNSWKLQSIEVVCDDWVSAKDCARVAFLIHRTATKTLPRKYLFAYVSPDPEPSQLFRMQQSESPTEIWLSQGSVSDLEDYVRETCRLPLIAECRVSVGVGTSLTDNQIEQLVENNLRATRPTWLKQ